MIRKTFTKFVVLWSALQYVMFAYTGKDLYLAAALLSSVASLILIGVEALDRKHRKDKEEEN